jgi:hypothetical protein
MATTRPLLAALLLASVPGMAAPPAPPEPEWRQPATGVEYAAIPFAPGVSHGDGLLHVVRVDPSKARLRALAASREAGGARTAGEWREQFSLVAVINAGMFATDGSTHTGFFRVGDHVNSSRWVTDYRSTLVFDPLRAGLPPAAIHDDVGEDRPDYGTVIQNLRLIKAPGAGVWAENGRRWSEAAVAMDESGRILLLFTRSACSMHELTRGLLALELGVVRAMHVEGGPEASLSVHGNGIDLSLSGSYETGFNENDQNQRQWPIPNVLGVEAGPGLE